MTEIEIVHCMVHGIQHPAQPTPVEVDDEGNPVSVCTEDHWAGAMLFTFPRKFDAEKRVVRVLVYEGTEEWVDACTEPREQGGAFVSGERNPFETPSGSITEAAKEVLP